MKEVVEGEKQVVRRGVKRKVCGVLAAQIVLTTVVCGATTLYAPITNLVFGNILRLSVFITLPIFLLWPMHVFEQEHPLNSIFLGLFTVCLCLTVGVDCANTNGRIMMEALGLPSMVLLILTGYSFWALERGNKDLTCIGPMLSAAFLVHTLTSLIHVRLRCYLNVVDGRVYAAVCGGLSAVSFLVCIALLVRDTFQHVKNFIYDH